MFPQWQATIREAQLKARLREYEEKRKKDVERKAAELKEGENLKFVLSLFGIDSSPVQNWWEEDDFTFKLDRYSRGPDRFGHEDCVLFELRIGRAGTLSERVIKLDVMAPLSVSWENEQAELADALDYLDKNAVRNNERAK